MISMQKSALKRVMQLSQMRMYHSVAKPASSATDGEKSVVVYDSPEFDSFSQASSQGNIASFDS